MLKLVTFAHTLLFVVSTPVFVSVVQLFVLVFNLYNCNVDSSIPIVVARVSLYVMLIIAVPIFAFVVSSSDTCIVLFIESPLVGVLFSVFTLYVAICMLAFVIFIVGCMLMSVFPVALKSVDAPTTNVAE